MIRTIPLLLVLIYLDRYPLTICQSEVRQATYILSALCNVTSDPYDVTGMVRGRTECGAWCLYSLDCVAFNYTDEGCSLYPGNLTFSPQCSGNDSDITTLYVKLDELPPVEMSNNETSTEGDNVTSTSAPQPPLPPTPCENGGVYDSHLLKCNCTGGWVGLECNQTAQGCLELSDAGYRVDGPFTIHPSLSPHPIEVFCSLSFGFGLTQIQQRLSDLTSFNRSWQEYKEGFHANGWVDFWLGNEKIYYLTNSISMRLFLHLSNGSTEYQRYYDNFVMADESSSFAVTYSNSWAPPEYHMEECWPASSLPFSTYDQDNDNEASLNCASVYGAGWWFESSTNCTLCNLNGVFLEGRPYTGDLSEAFIRPVDQQFSATYMALALWQM